MAVGAVLRDDRAKCGIMHVILVQVFWILEGRG